MTASALALEDGCSEPSDTVLVLAARAGDKDAFARLIERHRPLLTALCRRAFSDPVVAEDAVHEAILHALLSLDRLRDPERFGPWLGGIGLNISRRWLRERSRYASRWGERLEGGILDLRGVQLEPEALAEAADLADCVRRAVEGLPRGQRAAVDVFYGAGRSYAETARILGIEVSAVKARLHKARERLRNQLWTVWKEETMATSMETQPVDMRVADVKRIAGESDAPSQHVVVLEESGGTRYLAIWVGQAEGTAIAMLLEKEETPRPLTPAFIASLVTTLGGSVQDVRISRLESDVFYAVVSLDGPAGSKTVDARPSDAMALALALGAPIRVEPDVLAAAQVSRERRTGWMESVRRGDTPGASEIVADAREQMRKITSLRSAEEGEGK